MSIKGDACELKIISVFNCQQHSYYWVSVNMEGDLCVVCLVAVGEGLQCDACIKWQHRKCNSGITRELYRKIVEGQTHLDQWKCQKCSENDLTFIPTVESTRVSDVPDVPLQQGQVPDVPDVPHPEELVPDVPDVPFPDDAVSDLPADVPAEDDPDNILYQLPEVVEESSLNDPTPAIVPGSLHLTYTVVPSGTKKSKDRLIDTMSYTYNLFRKTSKYLKDWQCIVRGEKLRCWATVKQRGTHFTAGPHLHEADPGSLAKTKSSVVFYVFSGLYDSLSQF